MITVNKTYPSKIRSILQQREQHILTLGISKLTLRSCVMYLTTCSQFFQNPHRGSLSHHLMFWTHITFLYEFKPYLEIPHYSISKWLSKLDQLDVPPPIYVWSVWCQKQTLRAACYLHSSRPLCNFYSKSWLYISDNYCADEAATAKIGIIFYIHTYLQFKNLHGKVVNINSFYIKSVFCRTISLLLQMIQFLLISLFWTL